MKDRKNFRLVSALTIVVLSFVYPVRSATLAPVSPDMPLPQLMNVAAADINKFWSNNFISARASYTPPNILPYTFPIRTPCGIASYNNAFYCPSSNTIYFDNNFVYRFYSNVGDYAAVIILAHEWGHVVQAQSSIGRGSYFTIQKELQADCFAGAYTKYAESAKELDPGDLEEAATSLYTGGDPRGMPWFSPQAHGSPQQRINAFLAGYRGQRCFGQ